MPLQDNVSDTRFAELLAKFGGRLQVSVVCSWCTKMVVDGGSDVPISHTICQTCYDEAEKELMCSQS